MKEARHSPEMPANLESAYFRASRVTAEHALKPESFIGKKGFSREMVERDIVKIAKKKSGYERLETDEYKLAESFEAALFERINNSRWFGDRVNMVMCSDYDDDENHTDGVLEIQEGQGEMSHLGLAIDVTYNHDPGKKFEGIEEEIRGGNLSGVKYFRSSDGSFEDVLPNLPHAIVVLNAADATRVVRDWEQNAQDGGDLYKKVILRQLELQLETYKAYAKQLELANKKRFVISRFFEAARRNSCRPVGRNGQARRVG